MTTRPLIAALCLANAMPSAGQNAAPSSHLVFDDNFDGDIIINEVRVPKDGEVLYTYYETLGWRGSAGGYAGIQSHPRARNFIFSIWDHESHSAPIKAAYVGPGTLTENFGGEGTGLKSWNFELGWDTDTWYTLVSRCWPVGDHTFFGFWARSEKSGGWTHLVTMDVATKDARFQGRTDAFIEDWLETGQNKRTSHLRGGWKRKIPGGWHPFTKARYSVNSWDLDPGKRSFNFKSSWDGGVDKDATGPFYFMTAGGRDTQPSTENPSDHAIPRTEKSPPYTPIGILNATFRTGGDNSLTASWETDPKSLPQFSFAAAAYHNPEGAGTPLAVSERTEGHARETTLTLPKNTDPNKVHVRLTFRDILDNSPTPLWLPRAK